MRSTLPAPAEQALPLGSVAEAAAPGPDRPGRPGRPARARSRSSGGTRFEHRLGSDALASHGFPAGTVMIVDTGRRPQRGQILFVRTQGRLRVGVLDVQFGRSVLRSDHGTSWLDPATEVWGVATAADPPLEGLSLQVKGG